MSQPTTIRLAKAWGKHKAGAELVVLGPGVEQGPTAIDPQRAAQLARDGFVANQATTGGKKPPKHTQEA